MQKTLKENGRGEGFSLGLFVYAVVLFASHYIHTLLISLLMTFAPIPDTLNTANDLSELFRTTYPFLGFITLILYTAIVFLICFLIADKFAFKYNGALKIKYWFLQFTIIFIFTVSFGLYSTLRNNVFPLYWYLGASSGGAFGNYDYSALLAELSVDLKYNYFIDTSISYKFAGWIIVWQLITYVSLFAAMFFARRLGTGKGLRRREAQHDELMRSKKD